MSSPDKFSQIKRHFYEINREVIELILFERYRQQFHAIAGNSSVKDINHNFWWFTGISFLHEIVNRISRLSESQWQNRNKKIYSLQALLTEFLEHPQILSRTRYTGPKPEHEDEDDLLPPGVSVGWISNNMGMYRRLNDEFDKYAGLGADHLPKSIVKEDIDALKKVCTQVRLYRNKYLGHNSQAKGNIRPISFESLSEVIATITHLTRKYFLIFECASYDHRLATQSITNLFKAAWIPDSLSALIETEIVRVNETFDKLLD